MRDEAVAWFDEEAEGYLRRNARPSERLDDLARLLPSGARVLDLGCGPGVESAALAARGLRAVGLDAAPRMLALARRNAGVEATLADMRALPFRGASFDGVLALFSLIFLRTPDLRATLRALHALLVPRGAMLAAFQEGAAAEPGEAAFFRLTTLPAVERMLDEAGFEVVERWRRPPLATETPYAKLHVLARRR